MENKSIATMNKEGMIAHLATETLLKNCYCALVNGEAYHENINNVPHALFADLYIVVKCSTSVDGENGSFLVKNDFCEQLGVEPSKVLAQACTNTNTAPYKCVSLTSQVQQFLSDEEVKASSSDKTYLVSNESGFDGAGVITSPLVLDAVWEIVGDDYYVLPSSRHEVIVMPKWKIQTEEDVQALRHMVYDVNRTEVAPEDRLSDSVYLYTHETGAFRVV